jgi:hypothetical protein
MHANANKCEANEFNPYGETDPVEGIAKGVYVRRVNKDGTMQKATYIRGEYDRVTKRYSLTDCDDVTGRFS